MKIAQSTCSAAPFLVALGCLLFASCSSTGTKESTPPADAPKAAEAAAKKAEKKAKELETAKMELDIEQMSAAAKVTAAQQAVVHASFDLAEAQQAFDNYKGIEAPMQLESATIDLEQGRFRVAMREAELKELEDMYKKEQFATTTKELVLERGKKELEFAKREYAVAEKKHANLSKIEIPKKTRDLEESLRKAQEEASKAQAELKKTQAETQLELLKSRRKIETIEKGEDESGDKGGDKG